ncbi:VOC family protein [Cellulomonas sp. ICMP 17802]|uniref:VOC family protein n=1 Tax=Cellulomonas sp. ICMP 17802 TaxID=3239199 RepID=UPI00351BA632
MTDGIKTVVVPVSDLAASKAFYTRLLGVEPAHDAPFYVGFEVAGQHVGLNPNGDVSAGPVYYWHVDDLAATRDALVAAGATVVQDATRVGGSRTIATLTDIDGHTVGLAQDG